MRPLKPLWSPSLLNPTKIDLLQMMFLSQFNELFSAPPGLTRISSHLEAKW